MRAARERQADNEPQVGALPDFVIIGAQKCGTSSLYHLLIQHPYVAPAVKKEVHFFDNRFEEGIEWYRQNFPTSKWKDGLRTVTGEATPYYLFHPHVAKRMAEAVPQAKLIVLLRNPIDRAYSHYNQAIRREIEPLKFEVAIEAEEERLRGEREKMLEDERYASFSHQQFSYLSRGVYVDQLARWAEFFDREKLLVLKSEDFLRNSRETLELVLHFLGLPEWEPDPSELQKKRNSRKYEKMDPETKRKLEEYFGPHNKRLYDYLGRELGW